MTNEKIRVGISLRVYYDEKYDEKRDSLGQDWTRFLEKSGSIPIHIPNALSNTESFLDDMNLDAIILSGGDNMGDNPERDKTEREIIEYGIKKKIPIFGVCRGLQVINDYFGGSIQNNIGLKHVGKPHLVEIVQPKFVKLFKSKSLKVNSYHKNLIKKNQIGKDLKVFAIFPDDDTVEGLIHEKLPIMGVMWHPERDFNLKQELNLMKIFYNKLFT